MAKTLKNARVRTTQAAVGCGAFLIFFAGILGIVLSFFTKDPGLASAIRTRCIIGICIGVAMVAGWKTYKKMMNRNKD